MKASRTIPPERFERVRHLLESHRWVFAKTLPDNSHWYTVRREWDPDEWAGYAEW